MAPRCVLSAALLAGLGAACSTSTSGGNGATSTPANPFAGTWTCPYMTNSGYTGTAMFDFTVNDGGTLSSSTMSLPSASCTLTWSVAETTATVATNETCDSFTITSFSFTVSGNSATFSEAAVEHGTTPGPDGGTIPVDISGTVNGTCQNAAAIAAAAEAGAADASDGSFYGVNLTGPGCPTGQLALIQSSPPPNPSAACLQCFNRCQAKCQSTCVSYYKCFCACGANDGQCEQNCLTSASSYCQGCVQGGVDEGCFVTNCAGTPPACCAASGQGCGTAPGFGCCNGTCTNGMCP
ncbi:MAG: hypothetical protein M3O46_07010 [Myxococcota bacterium]|nr:hypothetical protein [Myxococcota bacterium]